MQRPKARELAPAAVLFPIVRRATPTVLFTQRTAHLARHAGQVSFPGGRLDENDPSLVETALRETREETGIGPSFISVAGFLDAYETGTGFAILPVVGLLDRGIFTRARPRTKSRRSSKSRLRSCWTPRIANARLASGRAQRANSIRSAMSAIISGAPPPPSW